MRAALVVQPLITRPIGTAAGDEVTVAYAWHPWAGRSVRLHEVIERATGASARCGLVDAPPARLQEIPLWMLDAAACRTAPDPAAGGGPFRAGGLARPALGWCKGRDARSTGRGSGSISRVSWRSPCNT